MYTEYFLNILRYFLALFPSLVRKGWNGERDKTGGRKCPRRRCFVVGFPPYKGKEGDLVYDTDFIPVKGVLNGAC